MELKPELPRIFGVRIAAGYEPVIIYDSHIKQYVIGLRRPGQLPDYAISYTRWPDRIRWQGRFPVADLERLGLNNVPFVRFDSTNPETEAKLLALTAQSVASSNGAPDEL